MAGIDGDRDLHTRGEARRAIQRGGAGGGGGRGPDGAREGPEKDKEASPDWELDGEKMKTGQKREM